METPGAGAGPLALAAAPGAEGAATAVGAGLAVDAGAAAAASAGAVSSSGAEAHPAMSNATTQVAHRA
jgi:hypothetical protein